MLFKKPIKKVYNSVGNEILENLFLQKHAETFLKITFKSNLDI